MPINRQYELVYIVAPTATDAEVEALQKEIAELVGEFGGAVENTDVWGRRKLAYEIGHHKEGIYVVQLLNGPGEMVRELGRRLRVRDQVLRHLTVRVDEDLRKVRRAAERKKATVQRRRAARGRPPLPDGDHTPSADRSPAGDQVAAGDAPAPAAGPPDAPAAGPPDAPAAGPQVAPVVDAGTTETAKKTSEVQE